MTVKDEVVATGRRKRSVASVRLRPGTGNIDVNGRKFEEYFPQQRQRDRILSPFRKLEIESTFDMIIRVKGGGIEGQVTATRLGISRALVDQVEERRQDLKALGFLTRDPRRRERKKFGRAGARKSFQFSKR